MNITISKCVWLFFCLILIAGSGCKNQQKAAEEAAAKARLENIAQAKSILNSILNDDGQMTLPEKEKKLRQARALNSDDPEVKQLITQVEEQIAREQEAQRLAQMPKTPKPDPAIEDRLSKLFDEIAAATSSSSANGLIEDGLELFSSPQTPVLIIISKTGNLKDYDEPTTIQLYLNYLKDQKMSPNKVYDLVKDDNGKVQELEMIKKSIR